MDPLALLCNLHADGPATLQRLRRTGCESLSALLQCDVPDLVERLDWVSKRAERFLREANHLADRIEGGLLEPEARPARSDWEAREEVVDEGLVADPGPPPSPALSPRDLPPAASEGFLPPEAPTAAWREETLDDVEELEDTEVEEEDDFAEEDPLWTLDEDGEYEEDDEEEYEEELPEGYEEEVAQSEEATEGEVDAEVTEDEGEEEEPVVVPTPAVQQIMSTWRALDRTKPPSEATDFVPQAAPRVPGGEVPLGRAALDGLTPPLAAKLAALGIGTLQALVEAPTLETSRRLSLGYTRLSRLQFLARRRLKEEADPGTADRRTLARTVTPGVRAYVAPPRPAQGDPERLDSSGPFA